MMATRTLGVRGLRTANPVLAPPRIMSVDRVPGVKMANSGAPVRETLTPEAAAGSNKLAAAVARQKAARAAELAEAQQISRAKASLAHESDSANGTRSRKLSSLLDGLNAKIDGQSLAKDVVARALRRRSMRLDDNERPLRLLFAGPSGVGKTAMATALCESLLGSCIPDRNFKRFNLSEFSHPSKFNRLTGGDPNYVGYKEGGELTNFIRNAEERRAKRASAVTHTSCVLLLDEVDRAAEGLLTFLMNFLDQGQLTSGAGEMVDATRAVVIMTTNCGRDAIASAGGGLTADPGVGAIHEMQVSAGGAALRRGGAAAEGRGGEGRGGEGRGGAAAGGGGPLETFSPRNAFGGSGGSMWDAGDAARRRIAIVETVKADVLRDICDGRYENLGRLGTIVPFLPLQSTGRRNVVERQLRGVSRRLVDAESPARLDGWSESLLSHTIAHWDDDLGGRSTRDFIEENVVEAIAEALDGVEEEAAPGSVPLCLDVELAESAPAGRERVVCRLAPS